MQDLTEQQKQQQKKEPAKYKVIFSDCNHSAILSEKELHNPIETQWDPAKLIRENVYVCHDCADGRPGFCHNTVLHGIHTAMRVWERP
jgi:hypothetical protein